MQTKKVISKCCVCGRERDDALGIWRFNFSGSDPDVKYSHGFCNVCYEAEIMKIKLRNLEFAGNMGVECPT